jgi:D-xylose transport system permease protein
MTDIKNDPVVAPLEPGEEVPPGEISPGLAATDAAVEIPPELVAQSLGQYVHALWTRLRAGESGVLPVVGALIVIAVVFQLITPGHVFLTADNLVNLLQQSAVYMVLGMAEIFVLLLGEIDLSIGFLGPLSAAVAVQLVQPVTSNWHWFPAILAALLAAALWGAVQGTLITRLRLPSFIVTLAGLLIANGLLLFVLLIGPFSGYPSLTGTSDNQKMLHNLMWGTIDVAVSWVVMGALVAIAGVLWWRRDSRRRRSGLAAPPASVTLLKIGFLAVVGVVVVGICSVNRAAIGTVNGVPWFVPIVLVVLLVWMVLLQRTRFGRYVYAIGGNPEAARRAGVSLARIRTWCFVLCSFTAGIAGLLYASRLDGLSNNVNGGQDTLYAVAAAVIGGTSLFGGRGRIIHGVLGGLVIGGIYNGMFLLGLDVKWEFIVTGVVLLASVTIDALSRRGSGATGLAKA